MKQGLLIFLLFAIYLAMARRIPRAVPVEESTTTQPKICARSTPCAWSFYKPGHPNILDQNVINKYCVCGENTACLYYDKDANQVVYRCQEETS